MEVIKLKDRPFSLEKPVIMGVINATPDSFFEGSRVQTVSEALRQAQNMVKQGVDIIDIGAASSRPGAEQISPQEEWKRLESILKEIHHQFPQVPLSVDTYFSLVARKALDAGASIINDISAFNIDPEMLDVIVQTKAPYILMHMKGTPMTMQKDTKYEDVISEMMQFFVKKIRLLRSKGVTDIIVDMGFGFGKSIEDNYEILNKLPVFKMLDLPILVGVSRKSMIYKLLDITAEESLAPTTALHLYALQQGAKILRVHDVKEAKQAIELHKMLSRDN